MNQHKFGFLILHYQVLQETIACIESIRKHVGSDYLYHIIVIDNASPNHSGEELLKRCTENDITIRILNENNGFSGGNNIGFQIAKELGCDFICMMNNDTEILQDEFIPLVLKEYERSSFAVLGPEIILEDHSVCHYPKQIIKLNEIEKDRERVKKLLLKNKLFIESVHLWLYKYIGKLIRWDRIRHRFRDIPTPDPRMENVRLHGCFMVFSPVYVNAFDGLDNRTFFYGEEEVLFVQLIRNHMKSVYQPEIKIFHHEAAATGAAMGKDYKKRRYIYETHMKIMDITEALYKEDIESIQEYILDKEKKDT